MQLGQSKGLHKDRVIRLDRRLIMAMSLSAFLWPQVLRHAFYSMHRFACAVFPASLGVRLQTLITFSHLQ